MPKDQINAPPLYMLPAHEAATSLWELLLPLADLLEKHVHVAIPPKPRAKEKDSPKENVTTTGNGNDRSNSKKSKKCARTGTGSSNGNSAAERCTSFELNNEECFTVLSEERGL
jgi:hypothetical protein